ncbi:MAG TPA: hypothetical protein VK432_09535 [Stellaceae bacterium]|nr:hypothetical protein [Stellaceae bacterium]
MSLTNLLIITIALMLAAVIIPMPPGMRAILWMILLALIVPLCLAGALSSIGAMLN